MGAVVVIAGAVLYVGRAVKDKWFWRADEYSKLTSLHSGYNLRYFEAQLGPPLASRREAGYRDSAFRGRDFWVQTISQQGVVDVYAVTSCSHDFHPTFTPPGFHVGIELNRESLSDVTDRLRSKVGYDYAFGVHDLLLYEGVYGGFEGFYNTAAWGFNSLCATAYHEINLPNELRETNGFIDEFGPAVRRFRDTVPVNTYIEISNAPKSFGISYRRVNLDFFDRMLVGPDPVLTQTEY